MTFLTDSQGTNQLYGGAGNDRLTANALTGSHLLDGGWATTPLMGVGASMVLLGGDGSDELNAHGNLCPCKQHDDLCAARKQPAPPG